MDNINDKRSKNISMRLILFTISSQSIQAEKLYGQSVYPELFIKSNEECLVVWNGVKENYSGLLAPFISKMVYIILR